MQRRSLTAPRSDAFANSRAVIAATFSFSRSRENPPTISARRAFFDEATASTSASFERPVGRREREVIDGCDELIAAQLLENGALGGHGAAEVTAPRPQPATVFGPTERQRQAMVSSSGADRLSAAAGIACAPSPVSSPSASVDWMPQGCDGVSRRSQAGRGSSLRWRSNRRPVFAGGLHDLGERRLRGGSAASLSFDLLGATRALAPVWGLAARGHRADRDPCRVRAAGDGARLEVRCGKGFPDGVVFTRYETSR